MESDEFGADGAEELCALLRGTEAAGDPEGRAGEPRAQHEAGEDVARPGAADGVQEAMLHEGPEPGVNRPGHPGGGRGQTGTMRDPTLG